MELFYKHRFFFLTRVEFRWKLEYREKTIDLSQVTDKLYHIMLYTSPWSRFELTTSVVIGTDCTGSCKSNYHTITKETVNISIKMFLEFYMVINLTLVWCLFLQKSFSKEQIFDYLLKDNFYKTVTKVQL
jgi:hypothetical protein